MMPASGDQNFILVSYDGQQLTPLSAPDVTSMACDTLSDSHQGLYDRVLAKFPAAGDMSVIPTNQGLCVRRDHDDLIRIQRFLGNNQLKVVAMPSSYRPTPRAEKRYISGEFGTRAARPVIHVRPSFDVAAGQRPPSPFYRRSYAASASTQGMKLAA